MHGPSTLLALRRRSRSHGGVKVRLVYVRRAHLAYSELALPGAHPLLLALVLGHLLLVLMLVRLIHVALKCLEYVRL